MQRFFYALIKSVLTLHDWKLPPLDVRNISILLTLQSQTALGKMPRLFLHPEITFLLLRGKIAFRSRASLHEQIQIQAVNSWRVHSKWPQKLHCLSYLQNMRVKWSIYTSFPF